MKVTLGQYAMPQHVNGPPLLGADAFWEPDHGIFGIASSTHHYDLYPIAERDVQAAFSAVHAALADSGLARLSGTEFLQKLLHAVHRAFGKIDLRAHIAGIEFCRPPNFPEPADDPESTPRVQIILLQLQGRRLSIACVGNNFLVYVVRSTGQELILGWDWSGAPAVVTYDFPGPFILAGGVMPEIYTWEAGVKPGDLIVATTHSLKEIVALARLDQLVGTVKCDPEAVHRHLMTTLASVVPEGIDLEHTNWGIKSHMLMWGAAWAIARVEE